MKNRLGRLETLGAWLHLWTPPRDVEIPPVPWRAIAVGTAVLCAGLGAAALLVVPRVTATRDAAREREQRSEAQRRAAFLAFVDREQRPRRGRGRADSSRAGPDRRTQARTALVSAAQSAIARDAGDRSRQRIDGVECEPFPRTIESAHPARDLTRAAAAYGCVAVTSRFDSDAGSRGGVIGLPFRLVVHFDSGRYAWCRVIPLGDRDRLSHPLPDACRLPQGA